MNAPSAAPPPAIGTDPGQTRLRADGPKPPLGRGGWPLPELTARQQRPKRWWRHPAFLVSAILTILAMLGMAAWMVVSAMLSSDVVVSDIALTVQDGNAHLDWEGPDAAYSVYAVHGDGTATDLSQFVIESTEVWLPQSTGAFESDTCFVVRAAASADKPVALDAAALAREGAQSVCVAQAKR